MGEMILDLISKKQFFGPILTVFAGFVAIYILKYISNMVKADIKSSLEVKKRTTIMNLIENIVSYVIYIVLIIIILNIFGINTAGFLTGLGIAGVVVGLALQDTIKDFLNGLTILNENFFMLGDIVEINSFTGEIIEFSIRSTKLKKGTGEVMIIANRNISNVINMSQKGTSLNYDIKVPYSENTEKVEKVILRMLPKIEEMEQVKRKGVEYLGINELGESFVIHTLVIKCEKLGQHTVKRKMNRLVKESFEKNNIKFPFKQIEVNNAKRVQTK